MKTKLIYVLGVALMMACSAPKQYSYHFDHYQYKTAKKSQEQMAEVASIPGLVNRAEEAERANLPQQLVASTETTSEVVETNPIVTRAEAIAVKYQKYADADSQVEKKTLRREIKHDIKDLRKGVRQYIKDQRADDSVTSTKALDGDLKLALIFLLLSLVGYVLFWPLGTALFIVSIVFFIMWLSRQ